MKMQYPRPVYKRIENLPYSYTYGTQLHKIVTGSFFFERVYIYATRGNNFWLCHRLHGFHIITRHHNNFIPMYTRETATDGRLCNHRSTIYAALPYARVLYLQKWRFNRTFLDPLVQLFCNPRLFHVLFHWIRSSSRVAKQMKWNAKGLHL